MATGDSNNMLARLRAAMPRQWLPDVSPVADAVLAAFGDLASGAYDLLLYAKDQTRVATATDGWLDLVAYDFFGLRFRRRVNEDDRSFANRIVKEVLRPRGTRQAVIDVITDLTGKPPYLYFEPANPRDTGGWGVNGHMGYGCAGRWGSMKLPYQAFVIPLRPAGSGIPNAQGFQAHAGDPAIGGFGQGALEYGSLSMTKGPVTDADIYAAIESVRAAGTVIWVSPQAVPPESFWDVDFTWDRRLWA